MTKKGILALVGIVLLVVGLSGAFLLDYTVTDVLSIVSAFVGAGLILAGVLDKKEGKTWKDYLFLTLISVGAVLFVFGGFTKETILTVVSALVTVIGIILYIIIGKKPVEKTE